MSLLPPEKSRWNAPQTEQPPDGQPAPRRSSVALWIGLALIVSVLVLALVSFQSKPSATSITYSSFLTKVAANEVKSVDINQSSGEINGRLTNNTAFTTQGAAGGMPVSDVNLLDQHKVQRNYVAPSGSIWPGILSWVLVFGLIGLVMFWFLRRSQGQMSSLTGWSRSRAKVHITEQPSTTFEDVAGYGTVKQELGEVVDFLRNPGRYSSIGARIPKGVLLVGPPGTGKTLLARAVAGEARVPFITITGSEFMEMFVGVGAARVRDLFATARSHTPSIVFIDEIDAIGRKRGTGLGGGHDEREQTLNQLLAEMDGFEVSEGIVMMAATNRPDILDPALLRAGRFDRQVVVPLPTLEERLDILRVHCRGKTMAPQVDLETTAKGTPGMSGADLENLVNEAALIAVRRQADTVEQADLEAARDRVLLGMQRDALALSGDEKQIVAYHEAGHAVLAELLPHSDPVHKVTILPTGMALGATQQLPVEERHLQQRPYLDDALAVRLGGRAAEEVVFGVPSTGAQDDLTAATELAGRMVREWGMSAHIGPMAWGSRGPVFLGEELVHTRDYSDETARVIDEEVARILAEQKERACRVLTDNRDALDALAAELDRRETLDGDEVRKLIRERNGARSSVGRRPSTSSDPGHCSPQVA
ncbi:MAG TPA: ATP-dependent zinc metalloprotease FtsH [Acidimicrobiales bacterium]|nr:ATP-dependent zinc metalloprotease FtsH [Acidimicrobiales bacterium]